ncbi:MAG: ATP synthase subunit I [Acidobacteria bacterium]|nr:ATP synthase subunit I [Acidobacteriota bacterium]MBS1867585.1 ATP synthase subunit I [Acidobacteriota bacterium]
MESEAAHANELAVKASRTEKRIAWLTLILGAGATLAALVLKEQRWAAGLAVGAGLAWLNFRLLGRGLDALVLQSIAQRERKKVQVPVTTYLGIAFRYALIGLSVYVIFVCLHVPLASLIFGLCSLAAAAIAASVWEVLKPVA